MSSKTDKAIACPQWVSSISRTIGFAQVGRFQKILSIDANTSARELMDAERRLGQSRQDLNSVLHAAPAMVGYWDAHQVNRFGNEAHRQWLGLEPAKMRGKHMREVIGDERYRLDLHCIEAVLRGEEQQFERDIPTADRTQVRRAMVQYVPDVVAGQVQGFCAVSSDITQMRQAEHLLRIASTVFETQQAMVITDSNQVILRVNKAFTEITGYSAEEAVGQTPRLLRSGCQDAAFYDGMWDSITRTGRWRGEIVNRRKNGALYPESLGISTVMDAAGLPTHYVAAFSDATSSKAAEEQMQSLAFSDLLTGLPNRRHLIVRLQQALLANERETHQGALLMINLDNFKDLNDVLGYEQGDLVLQQVAGRLSSSVRHGDTVAHLSGDLFAVLLDSLSHDPLQAVTSAQAVGAKILLALSRPFQIGNSAPRCIACIGNTVVGTRHEEAEEPLKRAELAMYQAKAHGRGTIRFFDPAMQAVVSARVAMETALREAIDQEQFLLHYQAQVNDQEQITGAEALLRWPDPKRGMVSPAEFIPLAEETGLILPIGNWVLETACRQLAQWAGQPAMAQLTLAVNVSARQFHQRDFVDQVLSALHRTGANPQRLKLELTESLLIDGVEEVIAKMGALKAIGVGFSLDDFGTGYSSLSYLKRLPLGQLKIDQGFVRDILIDTNDAAIAKMVIALADSMGLGVIAEGVETQAQRDFLAGLGCRNYQGYLFSRPLPIGEFEALLKV